ncbi:uncharacterized protein EI90DRAFT_265235 [Cantharellus anzutake]|uniref:uncharacterized protein n=1 Tax=Cantharellus anzutake TaxID=1750568 RepID=UPI0019044B02|nr:uncharacterized protein EI90DRAFT_265235 [Cantharellus anzutake]KAF8335845.1 hypothetical protein EI90DRAFT_265235 [Cantharellus anzutake]
MPRGNRRFDRITTSPIKKYHPYTAAEPKKFAYILNSHSFGNDPEASSSQKPKRPSRKAARADPAPQPTHSVSLAMPSGRVTTYRFGPGRSEPGFSGTGPVQSEPNAAFPRLDNMSESPLPPLVSRKSRATPWEPTPGRRLENSNNATYSRCRSSSPNSKSPSSPDRRNRPLRTRYDTSHRVPGSPSWDYEHARSGEDRSGHYPRDPCGTLPNTRSSGFRTTDRPSSQGTFRRCLPSVESIPGGSLPKPPLCSPSSTSPSRPSLSDEQNSQPTHSVTSSQFHSYPTSVPLQPAFDPTPRSIIPLPKFHRCFTIQQLCGTAEDSEPSWASEVAIIQGAPIRAVQSLAPTLEAEVLVNRWRNEASSEHWFLSTCIMCHLIARST